MLENGDWREVLNDWRIAKNLKGSRGFRAVPARPSAKGTRRSEEGRVLVSAKQKYEEVGRQV